MDILTKDIALDLLKKSLLNINVSFREGQYEAIDAMVNKRKNPKNRMGKKQRIFYFHKIFKAMRLWPNHNYIPTASANEELDRVGKKIGAQYCNNKFIKYRPLE